MGVLGGIAPASPPVPGVQGKGFMGGGGVGVRSVWSPYGSATTAITSASGEEPVEPSL